MLVLGFKVLRWKVINKNYTDKIRTDFGYVSHFLNVKVY